MKGIFALVITVGISALVWVAVQDWYERRHKEAAATVPAPAGPGPNPAL